MKFRLFKEREMVGEILVLTEWGEWMPPSEFGIKRTKPNPIATCPRKKKRKEKRKDKG